jgi:hypothetical protein
MGNPAKDDKPRVSDDDPRAQWPKTAKACTITGMSKRTLENRVRDGSLDYVYDSSGERHFDPESLDAIAGQVTESAVEADLTASLTTELRRALSDTLKANKDLLTLATVPAFKAAKLVRSENKALRKRCRQLETDRVKAIEAFEAALTESHNRELARKQADAHEARLDKGFDALLGQLPNIVNQLSFKKSLGKLFGSLTDDQKGLLFDMLTAEQLAEITRIMGQKDSDSKRSPSAKPSDTANGAPSQPAESAKQESEQSS